VGEVDDEVRRLRDEVDELRREVRELRDIEEIKQLKARYFQHVDAQRWDAWSGEVLAEDVVTHHDSDELEGRGVVVAAVARALEGGRTIHHGNCPQIAITGPDTAVGTWAMDDLVDLRGPDGPIALHGYGHYVEEYARTPAGWRIARSVLTRQRVDWITGGPAADGRS
jgi:hypothetical protein